MAPPRAPMRSRAVIPFAVCAVVAIGTLALPPYQHDIVLLAWLLGLTALIEGAVLVLPWESWSPWTHDLPALAIFPVLALLRETSGAGDSGLSTLVLLPLLWLALYGQRWSLYAAGALAALVFVAPLVVIGAPTFPLSDWRQALLWMLMAWLVAPAVQTVVRRLEARDREVSEANAELAAVGEQWEMFGDQLADTVVLVIDGDLRYRQITGSGAPRDETADWVGKTVFETASGPRLSTLVPLYRAALAGAPGSCALRASLSGSATEVTVVPFRYHGEPAAMVVARDITLAQRREAEIRQLHDRVEQVVDQSPIGVALADRDGRVQRINPSLRRLLRLGHHESSRGMTLTSLRLVPAGVDLGELVAGGQPRSFAAQVEVGTGRDARELAVEVVPVGSEDDADRSFLVNVQDVTEQRRFEGELKHLATHDPLTGLVNRRHLHDVLGQHLDEAARYGPRGAVLVLDLDNFKAVNDIHGHDAGDEVIVSVAGVLRAVLRESDVVARLGGDEFAVLLPHAQRADAEIVAARVVEGISAAMLGGTPGAREVTASVGAVLVTDPSVGPARLLVEADRAMYVAKAAGRDTYVVADATAVEPPATPVRA